MRTRTRKTADGGGGDLGALLGQRGGPDAPARLEEALAAIDGSGSIAGAFRLMGIAEEEIAARWPGGRKGGEPKEVFLLCQPTAPIRGRCDELYRAHVREIVERVTLHKRSEYARLTRAEVLGVLSEGSLRHPLAHDHVLLFEHLFETLLPGLARRDPDASYRRLLEQRTLLPEQVAERDRLLAEYQYRSSPERAERWRELKLEEETINGL
jgi:hypothetical protein